MDAAFDLKKRIRANVACVFCQAYVDRLSTLPVSKSQKMSHQYKIHLARRDIDVVF